ncbi:MAG: DNA-binding response regulator [Treponematales bacterium]
MITILVVEDDVKLNALLCARLRREGWEARGCMEAREAFDALYGENIDLIVSDIMMPGIDGFAFAGSVRKQDNNIPILFMSARDDIGAKEQGFRIGIDDYMVKPIDTEELVMRIRALLRRANIAHEKKIVMGSLTLNADERAAYLGDEEVRLTAKEFDVLFKLLSYPRKTFTRVQLMDEFWGVDAMTTPRSVDVYITKLREKFARCPDFEIVTVHGLGYKAVLK